MAQSWGMKNYDFSVPERILRLLKHVRINILSDLEPLRTRL